MIQKIIAFFTAIIAFFTSLFGLMPGTVQQYKNISYGDHPIRQTMDIYYPNKPDKIEGEVGAFILIHGGAWAAGKKEDYTNLAKGIASEGHVAATINYRLFHQDANYEDMLEDIDNAIKKLKEKAESDGITISKIATLGDSAGGHLSLMYAYTHLNGTEKEPAIPLAFCVGRVAPVDPFDPFYLDDLGDAFPILVSYLVGKEIATDEFEENYDLIEAAFPLVYASENSPPTILCYGAEDTIVPLSNGETLKAKLEDLGVVHEWFLYGNSGHGLDSSRDSETNEAYLNTLKVYAQTYF